jgi:Phage major capsid protein E
MQGLGILGVKRINKVMQTLRDIREIPQQLKFLNRTPLVNATDGEIMARFEGNVLAADIIGNDQRAVVRDDQKFTLETIKIPNLKHGSFISQEMLQLLERINAGGGIASDEGVFSDYKNRKMDMLLTGVRQRMEALIVACNIDALTYNRLGIKITGATWGMPADLKVTVSPLWTSASTSTPIDNILALKALGMEKYGENYDRLTMSSSDFRLIIATAEFTAKAQLYSQLTFPTGSFPSNALPEMQQLFARIVGMEVELYDSRYWEQAPDGSIASAPFLPLGKVILSSKQDDNTGMAVDLANGVVTESVVSSLTDSGMIGKFTGPEYGPVGYVTATPDYNPPNLTQWAVARCFPRKHRLSSTAVLTVR